MVALAFAAVLQAQRKGPLGSGFLAPSVSSAIYLQASITAVSVGGLPLVFGMTIVAGLVEVLFAFVIRRLRILFPPIVVAVIVVAVGLQLGLVGTKELLHEGMHLRGEELLVHVSICVLTVGTMVGLAVWGKGMFRLLATLIGLVLGTLLALGAGFGDPEALAEVARAPLVGLPSFSHLKYSFDSSLLAAFVVCGVASGLRAIGALTTCQVINNKEGKPIDFHSVRRGVAADGVGCSVAGLLGVTGTSLAPSLVGLSEATGVTSRVIAYGVGGWLLLFALSPKISAAFMALPQNVMGSVLIFTGSLILMAGIKLMSSRKLELRDTLIVGLPLLLGLNRAIHPRYFEKLPQFLHSVTDSILTVTTVLAILLNLILRIGMRRVDLVVLNPEEGSQMKLRDALARDAEQWAVPARLVQRASETLVRVDTLIEEEHLADGPVEVRMEYDTVSFTIRLEYSGSPLTLASQRPPAETDSFEEMPMAVGLELYLQNLRPDETVVEGQNDRYMIQLRFFA
jgi:NCS2 family nucleobase:cation symporter-2